MKVAICDDRTDDIEVLKNHLYAMNVNKLICDTYSSGESLISHCAEMEEFYDAIFLDMEMGSMNGINTANEIRKINKRVVIIFVSNHTQYMIESFECEPLRFLVKPVELLEFEKAFTAIKKKLAQERTTVVFSVGRDIVRLYSEEIIYFEKSAHQINVHTINETFKIRGSILKLYNEIDHNNFCVPHKSFIVNMRYIRKISEKGIELHGLKDIVPISRACRKELSRSIMAFKERRIVL